MREMNSRLSKKQALAVLLWLPVHLLLLPVLAALAYTCGLVDAPTANFLVYAVGAVYMLLVLRRLLRRDFDVLWEHPFALLLTVAGGYYLSLFGDTLVFLLLDALGLGGDNGNTEAVIAMVKENPGPSAAMAVILAPLVEECIFRAGFFGLLRRKSRLLAYLGSALLFGLYHVWSEAFEDPRQLLMALQYLSPGLVLAFLYERTDSLWSSIFLHMLINGLAVAAILAA